MPATTRLIGRGSGPAMNCSMRLRREYRCPRQAFPPGLSRLCTFHNESPKVCLYRLFWMTGRLTSIVHDRHRVTPSYRSNHPPRRLVERSHRLSEAAVVDDPAGDTRVRRILGSARRTFQADDRRYPVFTERSHPTRGGVGPGHRGAAGAVRTGRSSGSLRGRTLTHWHRGHGLTTAVFAKTEAPVEKKVRIR